MNLDINVRPACRQDAEQMLTIYNAFTRQFVGSAIRTVKSFRRMLSGKHNVNYVAVDSRRHIVGYVLAHVDKQMNRGDLTEIVVDGEHDFECVAKPLVEKVQSVFMEKKVSAIQAFSLRNPLFEKLFPRFGFFDSEGLGVFMYAVLDVKKFLNEISAVFEKRLKKVEQWNGIIQIECDGNNIFLQKNFEETEQISGTDQTVDIKIELNATDLTKLIFGVADFAQGVRKGELKIETLLRRTVANQIMRQLFPQTQFLIMDYW